MTVTAFPLRVRAFVFVRCPRTGRRFLCRRPRYDPISWSLLIFPETSRRRSHSITWCFSSSRILSSSSSERSHIFRFHSIPTLERIFCARGRPTPYKYMREISACFPSGRLIQAIRAIEIRKRKSKRNYPCRCLCFGSAQITRTTPFRRMIEHLLQIFFTEGRTFIGEKITKRMKSFGDFEGCIVDHSEKPVSAFGR